MNMSVDGKKIVLIGGAGFIGHNLALALNQRGAKVEIIDNKDNFSDIEWKELYQLSENTFVEENESLKQVGAGAGLTDND